ncbi:MAG TPA: hypothetical protein VI958_00625, partial [Acidobacteriota bacterium]
LTDDEKRVLQYASIEGEEFSSVLLAELLEVDELALEDQLGKLEKTYRLLKTTGEEELPDSSLTTKYRFVHALYRDLMYTEVLSKRRMLLHRRLGELLLKHYGRHASRIAGQLGAHFQTGRDSERAVEFLSMAADNAARIYANSEATSLYRKALLQIEELRKKDRDSEDKWNPQIAKLQEGLGDMLSVAGKLPEAIEQYGIAEAKMPTADTVAHARVLRKIAKAFETQRQLEDAATYYSRAMEWLTAGERTLEMEHERLELQLDQMWFLYTQNRMDEMEQFLESSKEDIEKSGTPVQRAKYFQYYLLLAYRRTRYVMSDSVMDHARRSLEAAKESGSLPEIANGHFVLGFASLWRGDLQQSEENLVTALQMSDRLGTAILQSRCITYITVAYRKLGDVEKTGEYAARALEFCTAVNMVEYIATAKANFAWVALRGQNFEEAQQQALAAFQTWRELKIVYPFYGLALWPLIAILVHENRLQDAVDYLRPMLEPSQQKLPDEFTEQMERAIAATTDDERLSCLRACMVWAEKEGYL